MSRKGTGGRRDGASPQAARRAFSLGLGLLPMFPLLAGCGGGSDEPGASAQADAAPTAVPASVSGVFRHPGLLVTEDDFGRIRAHIEAGAQPWTRWWGRLCADRALSLDARPNPLAAVYRLDNSKHAMYRDIQRAWCLALRWKLSDDTRYADKAVETLDAWADTLKEVGSKPPGSTVSDDHTGILLAGMQGHQWAQVGEIMRDYAGWAPDRLARFQQMLLRVFVSISSNYLGEITDKGWRLGSHANWHLASACGALAIGVFCDRPDLYRQACDFYTANNRGKLKMFGNGSIVHGVYFMHPGHLGQWQESGRDQGHSTLGMSLGGSLLEMAWNQGDDLYAAHNHRFLAAAEYVARSNLLDENGQPYAMPFASQHNASQPHTTLWTEVNQSFQHHRNAWEPLYNHYVNRIGLAAPHVERMVALCEPNYWSHGSDDMVFPTLTHRRAAYAGPMKPPAGLTVHMREGRAVLSWWGSAGAASYEVERGSGAHGPFAPVATVAASELLTCTDTPPHGVWTYRVTAIGSAGTRASADAVRIAAPGEARFLMPLNGADGLRAVGTLRSAAGDWTAVDGELLDGAAWGEGRRLGDQAVVFDGRSAGLRLPPGIFSGLDDFSVAMWAYAHSLRWDSCLLFAGHDGFSYMRIAPKAGQGMRFGLCAAGHNDERAVQTSGFMPTRRWVHVAVTLQGGSARIYVDGVEAASSHGILLSPRQVGDQVCFLGRNWGHPSFDGRIQDFRVHAGALGAAEIAALAQ